MIYAIYDEKDNDRLVTVFDKAKEVAKFFETSRECIYCAISRKQLRENRYRIEKVSLK